MNNSNRFVRSLKKRSIIYSTALMLLLVLMNTGFLIYNNIVQEEAAKAQIEAQEIKVQLSALWDDVVRNLDLGLRGFYITKDDKLLIPYNNAKSTYQTASASLHQKLQEQGYPDIQSFDKVRKGYSDYLIFMDYMVDLVRKDSLEMFKQELSVDRGYTLWKLYEKTANEINAYQDQQLATATARYKAANTRMTYSQILLAILGLPTILYTISRIVKDDRNRKELFRELERNNREYLFDPGTVVETDTDEREMIRNSIVNFKKAAGFISQISAGNLQVDWEGLNETNKQKNQVNLAGELIQMREKMKQLKAEDNRRMWATEGLAQFSDIIRKNQHQLKELCDQSISYLVKYLSAQQGAIYLLREEGDDKFLQMTGCYAFDRKKWIEKKVEIGSGLVGQVYLEQESVLLTEIPQQYTYITSGLGDATPSCLLIVPMMYNQKVEAVVEIAGFKKYDKYQLEWLEKVGEIMASTLVSIKVTEKTQELLEQFKHQTEQMRAQEEELRQNMEEMEATQEEMRRKEQELERRQQEMQELLQRTS